MKNYKLTRKNDQNANGTNGDYRINSRYNEMCDHLAYSFSRVNLEDFQNREIRRPVVLIYTNNNPLLDSKNSFDRASVLGIYLAGETDSEVYLSTNPDSNIKEYADITIDRLDIDSIRSKDDLEKLVNSIKRTYREEALT